MRSGGAADDDVNVRELARPILERHSASAQFGRQGDGLVGRAVGDKDAARAAREEGAGGLLAGVAGANDQHVAVAEPAEDLLRQLDRDRADGDAAALDVGFGADMLGDVERALEGLIEPAAGMAVFQREVVGFLELAEISVSPRTIESRPQATLKRCWTLCGSVKV